MSEVQNNIDNMIRMDFSYARIKGTLIEKNQDSEEALSYLNTQEEVIILNQVKKLFNSGFTSKEVISMLEKQGIDSGKYIGLINKTQDRSRPKGKYIMMGIILIFAGILLLLLCRSVMGSLRFSMSSRGDFLRWKELFFQPLNSLLAIALGIALIVRRKYVSSAAPKIILFSFGVLTMFGCLFFSQSIELLISVGVFILYILSTKKEAV